MSINTLELVSEAAEVSPASVDIKCESIALRGRQRDWTVDMLLHSSSHQFIWVARGGGRVNIDGTVRGFGANTAVFIPGLTVHAFSFSHGTQGWIVSVGPDRDVPVPPRPILKPVAGISDQKKVLSLIDGLTEELKQDDAECVSALPFQIGLLSIWYKRLDHSDQDSAFTRDTARRRLMRKFLQLMEERYSTQDTVNDYATNLEVTPTHLTRICRQTTGKPASTLIQDRVLLEARKSLTNTDRRISEIAEQLGYSNPAYFTRQFTDRVGESPSEFRKHSQ